MDEESVWKCASFSNSFNESYISYNIVSCQARGLSAEAASNQR